ncbi:uncharacterized protein [Physcomitrium patens]|uniref:EF-hand domain-containing protein n=2 Tax=Physcomitrium patens TaxID=3218 RepID=A0A7I4E5R9_PHYPA|nr:uncharacterized protein LOC112284799 isoform X2 [Physcomitrium patens]|eukprot:XP_024380816.1 uncharacterized protein LOC112284799 isoform X2 [Physcomitrella patens]
MEVQEQAGGWNPIVVLALHCHNVQKLVNVLQMPKPQSLPTVASISSSLGHEQPLNSFVSALVSVKKGTPPAVSSLLRQGICNDDDKSHCSCSCSNLVEPLGKQSNPTKAFFGLSLPNSGFFGGLDRNERAQISTCSSCHVRQDSWDSESKSAVPLSLGFSLQGFSITGVNSSRGKRDATSRCCCVKEKLDNRIDSKDSGLEGIINVSLMVMSMMLGCDSKQGEKRKHAANVHPSNVSKLTGCNVSKQVAACSANDQPHHPLMQVPILGFVFQYSNDRPVSQHSGPKCLRKRNPLFMCTCGHRVEGHDLSSRKTAERPFLGFSLANFMQFRKKAVESLVDIGAGRSRPSRVATLGFARLQGEPGGDSAGAVVVTAEGSDDVVETENSIEKVKSPVVQSDKGNNSGLHPIQVKLPNMDGLRSSLATLGVKEGVQELVDRVSSMTRSSTDYPDKKKLTSVQDFFRYTEAEGRRLFDELDRDSDGQVTLEDLEVAMKKRRLPLRYAKEFLRRTRKHWFAKSIGWSEFHMLMEQKEPQMLRAFTTLSLSKSGTLQKNQVLVSLRNAGLPATDGNAAAMMKFLNVDTEGSIAYGQFRNFMLLLPPERLGDDPRMVWFEAATVVPMAPPVDIPAGSVLKSALAGGMASALSTSMLHPLDTVKTRVQASTLSFPEVIAKLPQIGVRGMYRGSIPAILGQFTSHGIRTGVLEASKLLLKNVGPDLSDLQVQSLSSFTSTVIGTAVRIPCEVLKQRLQAGLYNSVGEAIVGTYQRDGLQGFFRGTGVTLCREVPFYVAGMSIYEEAKKAGCPKGSAQGAATMGDNCHRWSLWRPCSYRNHTL